MDTNTKIILDQLKRTQDSNDRMEKSFTKNAVAVHGLKSEIKRHGEDIKSVKGDVEILARKVQERGEDTQRFEIELTHTKADLEELKAKHSKISLRTIEGWKQVIPYLILGLAGVFGVFWDRLVPLFSP